MREPLRSVLCIVANVMATGQKGRLVCPGPNANYGELVYEETTEEVVDFIQRETGRQSLATCTAILVAKSGFEFERVNLVFKVELVDQPDQPFVLYSLDIPSMGVNDAPGLEIELLT